MLPKVYGIGVRRREARGSLNRVEQAKRALVVFVGSNKMKNEHAPQGTISQRSYLWLGTRTTMVDGCSNV